MSRFHFDIVQNTPEWYAIRAGKWTASMAATIMGGLDTKGLDDLIKRLAWERVFGAVDEPRYQSAAMARGHEMEEEARGWTAFNADAAIVECGFVDHPEIAHVGWSPDGLYSPDHKRAAEIKCLLHSAYLDMMESRKVPSEYRWQTRWAMWVGDLDGLDFIAYHPKPGGFCIPVERDPSHEDQMQARVHMLEGRVARVVERIQSFRSEA